MVSWLYKNLFRNKEMGAEVWKGNPESSHKPIKEFTRGKSQTHEDSLGENKTKAT